MESKEDFAYGLHEDNSLLLLPSLPALVVPTAGGSGSLMTAATKISECLAGLAKRREKAVKSDHSATVAKRSPPISLSDATGGILPVFN